MENDNKNKDKKNEKDIIIISTGNAEETVPLSTIRRMMNTLDRFLAKRFLLILALCGAVISLCAAGLVFANTSLGNAFSPGGSGLGGGNLSLNVWLWSIIAVFVFIAVVTSVSALNKKKSNQNNQAK